MIEINGISFARGKNVIFDDFSTSVPSNGTTLLSGPNGSGKTTLLQLIGGILKPSLGSIMIDGVDIAALKSKEQARIRCIAPQRRIFELSFTVEELFAIIGVKHRSPRTPDIFEALDLKELLNARVTELSLGQQQRVSVALALIQSADYYLLDEPFSAQDSGYTQKLLDLISSLSKETGIMVISHNTGQIEQYFEKKIYLS
jgi:ABC-type cobalamin/Fe3+-siderophores transport system ATPase subunit